MTWLSIPLAFYALFLVFNSTIHFGWVIASIVVYHLSMIALSVGNHRLFSHRAFKCSRFYHWFFAIFTTAFGNGSTFQWVMIHLGHHLHSDTELDPHTVTFYQFFKLKPKNIRFKVPYAKWILRDPIHRFTHRYALLIVLFFPIMLALISSTAFLFLWALPLAHHHITGNLFYIYSHNKDGAVDHPWLWIFFPFAGEWNHRAHHEVGGEKLLDNAQLPNQFDPGYWVTRMIMK